MVRKYIDLDPIKGTVYKITASCNLPNLPRRTIYLEFRPTEERDSILWKECFEKYVIQGLVGSDLFPAYNTELLSPLIPKVKELAIKQGMMKEEEDLVIDHIVTL